MLIHNCKLKNLFSLFLILTFLCGIISCKKKQPDENQNQETSDQINSEEEQFLQLFNFYSPALDDGKWVEEVIAQIEEERIADELEVLEEFLSEYQIETENPEDKSATAELIEQPELGAIEKFFIEEKSGNVLRGKNDELKIYEFDDEIFLPQYSGGNLVNIHADGKSVERSFYDENYHLVKKEFWNIPTVQTAALEKTETVEYFEDSSVISRKSIETKDLIEIINYSKTAKILSVEKFAEIKEKNQILLKRKLSYDSEDRLVSDVLTEYFYKDKEYQELDYSFEKKYVYTFNEEEIPPDFKYYENGVLKMLNKYSAVKGNYVSEIFFDAYFSVKTYYENDVRIKDVFFNNGRVMREKVYEYTEVQEVQNEKK